jgi:hypothetical protein
LGDVEYLIHWELPASPGTGNNGHSCHFNSRTNVLYIHFSYFLPEATECSDQQINQEYWAKPQIILQGVHPMTKFPNSFRQLTYLKSPHPMGGKKDSQIPFNASAFLGINKMV